MTLKSRERQDAIHTRGSHIDDSLDPSQHDTLAQTLQDTLDYALSQIRRITGEAKWFSAVSKSLKDLISGHVAQDEGSDLPQRANLNFSGAGVTATDDPGNDATVVSVGAGSLPSASEVGQVLYSVDGLTFEKRLPITTDNGWLVNVQGYLLVAGNS